MQKFEKNLLTNAKTYDIIEVQKRKGQTRGASVKVNKMKKANGMLIINEDIKYVCAFAIRTKDGDICNLGNLLGHYENMGDCIRQCVRIAKINGYVIPYVEEIGGKMYDIAVASCYRPFEFRRYIIAE